MNHNRVFIIAEAGVNHNGNVNMAIQLADAARTAGADAVKFQTFRAEDVVTPSAVTADYQKTNTGETSQFDLIHKLELDEDGHRRVAAHCAEIGIEFFSTPFSVRAVRQLVDMGVRRLKLPSGEITNRPLIESVAATGLPLIVSTGMSTMEEVVMAVGWIAQRWLSDGRPVAGPDNLAVLHCTSSYPAPSESLNLRAIRTLSERLGLPVGYSDHSQGLEAALAAVALGATVIEKHLTLDKALPGPDHRASADPHEFTVMVAAIRKLESMLGDGVKRPHPIEMNTRDVARRSIVVVRNLLQGHRLEEGDLALRRPGTGLQPAQWGDVIGGELVRDTPAHTTLTAAMLRTKKV